MPIPSWQRLLLLDLVSPSLPAKSPSSAPLKLRFRFILPSEMRTSSSSNLLHLPMSMTTSWSCSFWFPHARPLQLRELLLLFLVTLMLGKTRRTNPVLLSQPSEWKHPFHFFLTERHLQRLARCWHPSALCSNQITTTPTPISSSIFCNPQWTIQARRQPPRRCRCRPRNHHGSPCLSNPRFLRHPRRQPLFRAYNDAIHQVWDSRVERSHHC